MYVVTSLLLTNVVNVENVVVCLYLQNNIRLLLVSLYNLPDTLILHSDLDSVFFSSFVSVGLVVES
jgi:hypothetical protein